MKFFNFNKKSNETSQNISIGSVWISKYSWGDVSDLHITSDDDKKTTFTVEDVIGNRVFYKIKYDGNPSPDKIHKDSKINFLQDLKPKK